MLDSMIRQPARGSLVHSSASENRQYLLCRLSKPRGSALVAFASSAFLRNSKPPQEYGDLSVSCPDRGGLPDFGGLDSADTEVRI